MYIGSDSRQIGDSIYDIFFLMYFLKMKLLFFVSLSFSLRGKKKNPTVTVLFLVRYY